MKRLISLFLVTVLCMTALPFVAIAAEQPTSWAVEQVARAVSLDLVPAALQSNYTQPATRAEFCSLAVRLYEEVTGTEITQRKFFLDSTDADVQKMGGLGVVNGVGGDQFAPNETLNREQAAVVLANLSNALGRPLDASAAAFADSARISSWAVTQVGQIQAAGIMGGVGDNNFAPKDPYTREQSITTMLRMYDLVTPSEPIVTQPVKFLTVADVTVSIGDTLAQVESVLGEANRIDPSNYDFNWHVYNGDYGRFIMVGIKNNTVEALYSNAKGFVADGVQYGDLSANAEKGETVYTDQHENGIIHAYLYVSDNAVPTRDYGSDFYRAQELENFDATNAFRVNHGLNPLEHDEDAALVARNHSQDMADNNYFSHTSLDGLSPWDRYNNVGGKHFGSGENISAGRLLGIDAFDGWVNSEGHRNNMLGNHRYLGVGYGTNSASTYTNYLTQFFSA